ncbi:MAG TPA: hypothetical protein VLJ15_07135 [Gammaproteobacteria bacterium]|nr:hypothetical protein [Gammaproteobacteria bacterium]
MLSQSLLGDPTRGSINDDPENTEHKRVVVSVRPNTTRQLFTSLMIPADRTKISRKHLQKRVTPAVLSRILDFCTTTEGYALLEMIRPYPMEFLKKYYCDNRPPENKSDPKKDVDSFMLSVPDVNRSVRLSLSKDDVTTLLTTINENMSARVSKKMPCKVALYSMPFVGIGLILAGGWTAFGYYWGYIHPGKVAESDALKRPANAIYAELQERCGDMFQFHHNQSRPFDPGCTIVQDLPCGRHCNKGIPCEVYDPYFLECGMSLGQNFNDYVVQFPLYTYRHNPVAYSSAPYVRLVKCSKELMANYTDYCQAAMDIYASEENIAAGVCITDGLLSFFYIIFVFGLTCDRNNQFIQCARRRAEIELLASVFLDTWAMAQNKGYSREYRAYVDCVAEQKQTVGFVRDEMRGWRETPANAGVTNAHCAFYKKPENDQPDQMTDANGVSLKKSENEEIKKCVNGY